MTARSNWTLFMLPGEYQARIESELHGDETILLLERAKIISNNIDIAPEKQSANTVIWQLDEVTVNLLER